MKPMKDVIKREVKIATAGYEAKLILSCGHSVTRHAEREAAVKRARCGSCQPKPVAAEPMMVFHEGTTTAYELRMQFPAGQSPDQIASTLTTALTTESSTESCRLDVWCAVDTYIRACGGDPTVMNGAVMRAVCEIDKAIDALVSPRTSITEAGELPKEPVRYGGFVGGDLLGV